MEKVAIYVRVSTDEQSTEMQTSDLTRYCEQRGFKIYKEYSDQGVSGTKDKRPALDELMNDAKKRKFDVVLVWRFDRFARSTKHLVTALEDFKHLGIDFISYQENIDTSSPIGKAMFTIASAFSELESNITKERIVAGLQNAKAKGIRLGRRSLIDTELLCTIRDMRDRGMKIRPIARHLNVSPSLVHKTLKILRQESLENQGVKNQKELSI
jgi:DNA invertase Pin-like site-specific DNA recombinase